MEHFRVSIDMKLLNIFVPRRAFVSTFVHSPGLVRHDHVFVKCNDLKSWYSKPVHICVCIATVLLLFILHTTKKNSSNFLDINYNQCSFLQFLEIFTQKPLRDGVVILLCNCKSWSRRGG